MGSGFLARVSIIVPVYNAEAYLPGCLQSLLRQTLQEVEIILVDDGSTDGSAAICQGAAQADVRVRVVQQDNFGSTEARKAGLRLAGAEYVTFVDADDWIEPELCECLYAAMTGSRADLAIGGHCMEQDGRSLARHSCLAPGVYDRGRLEGEVWPVLLHNDFCSEWSIWPYLCGKLFRREMLLPLQEQVDAGISLGDDVCVTFPYIVRCRSVVLVDKPLYHYVQHSGSQFHSEQGAEALSSFRRIWEIVSASFQGQGQEACLREQLRIYMLTTILLPRSPWLLPGGSAFPFAVPCGSRVAIYGAGILGTALHESLGRTHFAEPVLWLDARAATLREAGWQVASLAEAGEWPEFDFMLVAVMNRSVAASVRRDLLRAGVDEEKILCLNEAELTSEPVWRMFGLEDSDGA